MLLIFLKIVSSLKPVFLILFILILFLLLESLLPFLFKDFIFLLFIVALPGEREFVLLLLLFFLIEIPFKLPTLLFIFLIFNLGGGDLSNSCNFLLNSISFVGFFLFFLSSGLFSSVTC